MRRHLLNGLSLLTILMGAAALAAPRASAQAGQPLKPICCDGPTCWCCGSTGAACGSGGCACK